MHARRGQRDSYQPIRSQLCASADPLCVAKALHENFSPHTLYIADLDAITQTGSQLDVIRKLGEMHSDILFWLDAGFRSVRNLRAIHCQSNIRPVIGSEMLSDLNQYQVLRQCCQNPVLSLDFCAGRFLGPAQLETHTNLWTEDVIVMDLDHVGGGNGPPLTAVSRIRRTAAHNRIYAAGGVRNMSDLTALATAGAAGVLLATALHNGTLTRHDLAEFSDQ